MSGESYAERLRTLAAAEPTRPAVTCGAETLTRSALVAAGHRLARDLAGRGVLTGDLVTIGLPNSVDFVVAMVACWDLGAIPQPVSTGLPAPELQAIVDLADPAVLLGVDPSLCPGRICLPVGYRPPAALDDGPLPDAVSPSWKAPTSGGSTGRPKLTLAGDPSIFRTGVRADRLAVPEGCSVITAPMHHNGPVVWAVAALLRGAHVVMLPRFDAEAALAAVERHRADVLYVVPTAMRRIWRLPAETRDAYDLSSLKAVWHVAEPCPPWLKEAWIDWLGAGRIYELYAGTEAQAATAISGHEWLAHRGSVGRPVSGQVEVCDDDGRPVRAGVVGEIWMRSDGPPTYRYIGAEARRRDGGWESLGDRGWLDEEGYVYLADREQDMILVGGRNVYPAEVEAAIGEHPAVRSCAVIGLPDDEHGNRVHAIVEASPEQLGVDELLAFVGERLVRWKLPRSVELIDDPLRDDAGKVRRAALRAARLPAPPEATGAGDST